MLNIAGGPEFRVLLGTDYAGKSSIMRYLRRAHGARGLLSIDAAFLAPQHALLTELRRALMTDVVGKAAYSADFVAAMLQLAVIHLRDQLSDGVLVDSYYYKILAKCRLAGVEENPMFGWWRSFPQPRSVIYLDVPTEVTWQRAGHGASLNPLEHYGERPDWHGFATYQRDLRKMLLDELNALPVNVPVKLIAGHDSVARTARAVREAIDGDA